VRKLLPLLLVVLLFAGALAASAALAATASSPGASAARRHHRHCDPNYRGRCLRPNVSDYDCAGGSGNGPYYVSGPFRVVGYDHYRLDADHDGIACES
jgi:hypothetical protein